MKQKMYWLASLFFAGALLVGCAQTHYVPNTEIVLGEPNKLTLSEKERMASDAVEKMRNDPNFNRVYTEMKHRLEEAAQKRGNEAQLPLIAMDELHNRLDNGVSNSRELGQVSNYLQNDLRQTGLFDIMDDFVNPDMLARLMAGANRGEAGGLDGLRGVHAPDLWLTGDLRMEKEDDIYTFTFNLKLMDTATQRFFWSGTIERRKTK